MQQNIENQENYPVQQKNPFEIEEHANSNIPDQPVSYGNSMAESLLNDNEVPEELRKEYWQVFHKDNTLGFLDENRKQSKMLNFDIMKIDELNTLSYYDYTFEVEKKFGTLRNVFETKLDRALGIKGGNVKNERLALISQFSENRNINDNGEGGMVRENFFRRLLGRR